MKLKYLSKRNLRKIQDWSSGFLINSKEFYLMKKQDFECEDCGKDLIKDYDYPSFKRGGFVRRVQYRKKLYKM